MDVAIRWKDALELAVFNDLHSLHVACLIFPPTRLKKELCDLPAISLRTFRASVSASPVCPFMDLFSPFSLPPLPC